MPRAIQQGSRQRIFFKKKNNLCRAPAVVALGKEPSTNAFLATAVSLYRVLTWLSAKPLPRACHVALGKDCLCRLRLCRAGSRQRLCRERSGPLPSARTLGKVPESCSVRSHYFPLQQVILTLTGARKTRSKATIFVGSSVCPNNRIEFCWYFRG